ncbi:hypothetical protein [Streptomyces sp. NPDC015125]
MSPEAACGCPRVLRQAAAALPVDDHRAQTTTLRRARVEAGEIDAARP